MNESVNKKHWRNQFVELGLLTEDNSSLSMDDWESYVDFTDDDTIDNIVATVPPVSFINEKTIYYFILKSN